MKSFDDFIEYGFNSVMVLMMVFAFVLFSFLIISGAIALFSIDTGGNTPTGQPRNVDNTIVDISFAPAHSERSCIKCGYHDVPDTWFILFCSKKKSDDCFSLVLPKPNCHRPN